jgi:transcriptional regulator with XRE-family HTH domain
MNNFGDTVREFRRAQELGLRETAVKIGISPAYLSRIERGKEHPPKAETIKALAKTLAADPDVLFRLSSSTDPELTDFLRTQPRVMHLIRYINEVQFTETEIEQLINMAEEIRRSSISTLSIEPSDMGKHNH